MVQTQPVKKQRKKTGVLYKRIDEWYFLDDILEEHGPYEDKEVAVVKLKQIIGDYSRRG